MSMSLEPSEEVGSLDKPLDSHCQTALFERYGQSIFAYLRLHTRSLQDAEDLLLDVFLAGLENDNLSALSPPEQLAWLRRVAHNKLLNTYRRNSRSPSVTLDSIGETLFAESTPEQATLQQEEHRQLRAALQKLPTLQQHILQLRYGDGLRCPEIALLLNKREGAVRKILSRSIHLLRQIYRQTEGEQPC